MCYEIVDYGVGSEKCYLTCIHVLSYAIWFTSYRVELFTDSHLDVWVMRKWIAWCVPCNVCRLFIPVCFSFLPFMSLWLEPQHWKGEWGVVFINVSDIERGMWHLHVRLKIKNVMFMMSWSWFAYEYKVSINLSFMPFFFYSTSKLCTVIPQANETWHKRWEWGKTNVQQEFGSIHRIRICGGGGFKHLDDT